MTTVSGDCVIVGGGAAGCVLAARLSEDPDRTVILLEAGTDYGDRGSMPPELLVPEGNSIRDERFIWGYEGRLNDRQPAARPVYRGRVIGGSGAINGCIFLRGEPGDYDAWGSPLWTWEAVLPYFNKLETDVDFGGADYHGADGPMQIRRQTPEEWLPFGTAFREAALAAGYVDQQDLNEPGAVGVGPMPRNVDAAHVRLSPALSYLLPARARPNLQVVGDTLATRITFAGARVTGVEAVRGGEPLRVEAAHVIVAAGAIASPQLLMLSGVGRAAELRQLGISVVAELPGVGANLSDHPVCQLTLQAQPEHAHPADSPSVQLTLLATAGDSASRRDLQIGSHSRPADPGNRDEPPLYRLTCSLGSPLSRGTVSLASTDATEPARIEYHYMEDPVDLERMRYALRTCARLARDPALQEITVAGTSSLSDALLDDDAALDAHIVETVGTAFHGMGTCRMGAGSDPLAVVDDRCRVHGLDGLQVVDASVAPAVTRGNAHATVLMIAEHAAAQIRGAA